MESNEIKTDLEKRKNILADVSAYTSLRNAIKLLCTLYIVGIIIWLSFGLIITLKSMHRGSSLLATISSLTLSAFSIFIAIIIRDFALAIIDSIDLQLLSNRRNELERKKEKI